MHTRPTEEPPPAWAHRVLARWCRAELYEELSGDLEEEYRRRLLQRGRRIAALCYAWDVLFLLRTPLLRRGRPYANAKGPVMWKNYFKVGMRNLGRHKGYVLLNAGGLALGLACCLLIAAFVRHEWSYDRFHEHADAVHRVLVRQKAPDGTVRRVSLTPLPLAPTLREAFPQVDQAVRLADGEGVVQHGEVLFTEPLLFADAGLFDVFTFPLVQGDARTALVDPQSVVLTTTLARKYFGDGDPMGQTLSITPSPGERVDFVVTGVAEPVPGASSIAFDLLIPFVHLPGYASGANNWGSSNTYTYARLADGASARGFEREALPFVGRYFGERIRASREQGSLSADEEAWMLQLQPITAVHLDPDVRWGLQPANSPDRAYVLLLLALIVLGIACINFVMLTLARSAGRAREVGLRKVLGARRGQVMGQFWGEAVLMSAPAMGLGLGLALLAAPAFGKLAGIDVSAGALLRGGGPVVILGLTLLVGLVAGGYPALFLSRWQPAAVLKGRAQIGRRRWQRGQVVVQFGLSIALIICTLVMARQQRFLQTKDLGYEAEQVVVIPTMDGEQGRRVAEVYRQEVRQQGGLLGVSSVNNAFTRGWMSTTLRIGEAEARVWVYRVDYGFVETLGLRLREGRSFDPAFPGDEGESLIVNEAFVRAFGAGGDVGSAVPIDDERQASVVGTVEDFHFLSLREAVEPAVLQLAPGQSRGNILVKVAPGRSAAVVERLEALWKQVAPGQPFSFFFLDQAVQRQYEAEARWGLTVRLGAGLALLIACCGLFALAALTAEQRKREVGIRKIFGSSVAGLVALLTREFVVLVLIALVLAGPPAYFAMERWLEGFTYRVDVGAGAFVAAGLVALGIALVTVGYQAVRTALVNPVDTLRYE